MVDALLADPRWWPSVGSNTCDDGIIPGRRLRVVIAGEHVVPVVVTAHGVDWEDEA